VSAAFPRPTDVLAHRPPFLFVDEVTALVPGQSVTGTWTLTGEEWFFAGHFPGQPLLPGALLLAELQEAMRGVPALRTRLGDTPTLAAAKFLAPVRPGASLVFELTPEEGAARGVRFDVRLGDALAATGRWLPGDTGS